MIFIDTIAVVEHGMLESKSILLILLTVGIHALFFWEGGRLGKLALVEGHD